VHCTTLLLTLTPRLHNELAQRALLVRSLRACQASSPSQLCRVNRAPRLTETFSVFGRPVHSVEEQDERSSVPVHCVYRAFAVLANERRLMLLYERDNVTQLRLALYSHTGR